MLHSGSLLNVREEAPIAAGDGAHGHGCAYDEDEDGDEDEGDVPERTTAAARPRRRHQVSRNGVCAVGKRPGPVSPRAAVNNPKPRA